MIDLIATFRKKPSLYAILKRVFTLNTWKLIVETVSNNTEYV
jgi:hypothetical protein